MLLVHNWGGRVLKNPGRGLQRVSRGEWGGRPGVGRGRDAEGKRMWRKGEDRREESGSVYVSQGVHRGNKGAVVRSGKIKINGHTIIIINYYYNIINDHLLV